MSDNDRFHRYNQMVDDLFSLDGVNKMLSYELCSLCEVYIYVKVFYYTVYVMYPGGTYQNIDDCSKVVVSLNKSLNMFIAAHIKNLAANNREHVINALRTAYERYFFVDNDITPTLRKDYDDHLSYIIEKHFGIQLFEDT